MFGLIVYSVSVVLFIAFACSVLGWLGFMLALIVLVIIGKDYY
jgi:hypothetical protein